MTSELPRYDEGHIRSLSMLMNQGEVLGEAYINYSRALRQVIEAHSFYHENPSLKSRFYTYQSALVNLESTKALIHELKDEFLKLGVCDWLP